VGKDNKKIVLSVFLLIFAGCGRNERAEKAEKNEKAGKTGRIVRAEKNEKAGRSLLFQHNLR
jgi:lipoprotein